MMWANELDDRFWDELPAPLQAAAAKLGYNHTMWNNDQEPDICDENWSELTTEQQKAAISLGYTPERWDSESCNSESSSEQEGTPAQESIRNGDWVDSPEQLENRIKTLKEEIIHRQKKLKTLLREKEGTAYAQMIQSHEDCVNSHLQRSLTDIHPDSLHQNRLPYLKQNPLQIIRTIFLNEFYHTLPGCAAIMLHCILYCTLTDFVTNLSKALFHHVTTFLTGWHIIDTNYDDLLEEHLLFFVAILFSFSILRVTGGLYEWNDNRRFQRRVKFHFRNRWHLRCWDIRAMNWFSGGEMRGIYGENTGTDPGPNDSKGEKWGPRLKYILDIFCFFSLFCCVDQLVDEFGPKIVLDMKDRVLEGLPSRQLHQQWGRNFGHEQGEQYCISSGNGTEECLANLEMDVISDVWNWVKNSDRCGWSQDEEDRDEEDRDEEDQDEEDQDEEDQDEEDQDECDDCHQKQDNESDIFSIANSQSQTFKPWKHADEGWKRMINIRDDEYLRASISRESYFDLVGDPEAHFIDPVREQLFLVAITGFSLGCLYWFDIPFQLI